MTCPFADKAVQLIKAAKSHDKAITSAQELFVSGGVVVQNPDLVELERGIFGISEHFLGHRSSKKSCQI